MIIKGLKINYKTLGEGRPLLILHGWGSRGANWMKVVESLAGNGINPVRKNQKSNNKKFYPNHSGKVGLSNGVKVIIPDLPGFGQSDKPPKAWNIDDYRNFIEEFVKTLNLEKFYLLGHSFGGSLAIKFSLQHSEKIDKLFLVSAACIRKKTFKNKLFKFLSKFIKIKTPFLRKVFYRKSDYLSVEGVMKETYLKIIKQDLSDVLPKIQIPTVIIWGEKDNITPLNDARIINQKIKGSKLEIISNVGHDLNLKAPEKLAEVISKNL